MIVMSTEIKKLDKQIGRLTRRIEVVYDSLSDEQRQRIDTLLTRLRSGRGNLNEDSPSEALYSVYNKFWATKRTLTKCEKTLTAA